MIDGFPTEAIHAEEQPLSTSLYYKLSAEGVAHPLDPITGEPMTRGAIPESLLHDDELKVGFDFLQNTGANIKMSLLLTRHDEAGDLHEAGIDLEAEAIELAEQGGMLFLEGVDSKQSRSGLQQLLDAVSRMSAENIARTRAAIQISDELTPFMAEVTSAVTGTNVKTVRPDYMIDSHNSADTTLAKWNKELDSLLESATSRPEAVAEWYYTNLGFTAYRDWYLVGKIGSYFAGQAQHDGTYFGKLLVGSNHVNIGKHFEAFGADVSVKGEGQDERTANFQRSVGNMAITAKDKNVLLG